MDRVQKQISTKVSGILRDYVSVTGSFKQAVQFLACTKGLKPAMDDWLSPDTLSAFTELCRVHGLYLEIESRFEPLPAAPVVGIEACVTTFAAAKREGDPPAERDEIHVMVGARQEDVRDARRNGWYGLAVRNRIVQKPWMDHYRFGRALGYPKCCRRSFASDNDWRALSAIRATFERTLAPAPICNSLWKSVGVGYVCHIPCSFDCGATTRQGAEVRATVARDSPAVVEVLDWAISLPVLVLSEWDIFAFNGRLVDVDTVAYEDVYMARTSNQLPALLDLLQGGNRMTLVGSTLHIFNGAVHLGSYGCAVRERGPQDPILLQWGSVGAGSSREARAPVGVVGRD